MMNSPRDEELPVPNEDSCGRKISERTLTFRKRRLSLPLTSFVDKDDEMQERDGENDHPIVKKSPEIALIPKRAPKTNEVDLGLQVDATGYDFAEAKSGEQRKAVDDEEDYGYEPHEPDYGYETHHPDSENDGSHIHIQHTHQDGDNHSVHSTHSSEADEKAQTFRKRRLSLTTTTSNNSGGNASTTSNTQIIAPDQFPDVKKRQRRFSQDSSIGSAGSINSESTNPTNSMPGPSMPTGGNNPTRFISRTLHAGELLPINGLPPPSPAVNSDNVLYRQNPLLPPSNLFTQQLQSSSANADLDLDSSPHLSTYASHHLYRPSSQTQPRWKRRKTLCHQTEQEKFPFSSDVVGTYSCHGVEPIYDSEYEEEEDESGNALQMPQVAMAAKINQDRGGVAFPYGNHPRTAIFAVYDGHGYGGELVSQYALYEIQRRLEKHPKFVTNLPTALTETFVAVDESLKHEPLIDPLFAGTTACVAIYQNSTLVLANAGDSRAVCARRVKQRSTSLGNTDTSAESEYEYVACDLTQDQNPDVPAEMERIISMGGYVSKPPSPGLSARVWLDAQHTQIGLAMARSIGDHAIASAGVIAEPVVTCYEVTADDEFLILASDGVWEFISSSQAVKIIADNLDRGATKACQALIEYAASRWHEEEGAYRDDITAIVVRLQHVWKANPQTGTSDTISDHKTDNED